MKVLEVLFLSESIELVSGTFSNNTAWFAGAIYCVNIESTSGTFKSNKAKFEEVFIVIV